jgi:hypothetical protein
MTMQLIPKFQDLLSKLPAKREFHGDVSYKPSLLTNETLVRMRAPPEYSLASAYKDDEDSQSDLEPTDPVGAYPGTAQDYQSGLHY